MQNKIVKCIQKPFSFCELWRKPRNAYQFVTLCRPCSPVCHQMILPLVPSLATYRLPPPSSLPCSAANLLVTRTGTQRGVSSLLWLLETPRELASWSRTLVQAAHTAVELVDDIVFGRWRRGAVRGWGNWGRVGLGELGAPGLGELGGPGLGELGGPRLGELGGPGLGELGEGGAESTLRRRVVVC